MHERAVHQSAAPAVAEEDPDNDACRSQSLFLLGRIVQTGWRYSRWHGTAARRQQGGGKAARRKGWCLDGTERESEGELFGPCHTYLVYLRYHLSRLEYTLDGPNFIKEVRSSRGKVHLGER